MPHLHVDTLSFFIALPFLIGILFLILKFSRKIPPYLPYSNLSHFAKNQGVRSRYTHITPSLFILSAIFFFFAFLDPALTREKRETLPATTEGKALYLVLDKSSSMKAAQDPTFPSKLDLLKEVTQEFIKRRSHDLIGLVSFARAANVLSPLTLDHDQLLTQLNNLQVAQKKSEDGTAIGYAIYKTSSVLAATRYFGEEERKKGKTSYNIQDGAIILVTDGFQFPHPEDRGKRLRTIGIEEAAQYAKDHNVRLYIINIDPLINDDEFAPQRRLMQRSAELTEGQFFTAPDSKTLSQIFDSIEELEVSTLPLPTKGVLVRLFSFAPWLIACGLLALSFAILSETLFFRRVP